MINQVSSRTFHAVWQWRVGSSRLRTSVVCTANISIVKSSFLLCTVSHCTTLTLWEFGCCLKCPGSMQKITVFLFSYDALWASKYNGIIVMLRKTFYVEWQRFVGSSRIRTRIVCTTNISNLICCVWIPTVMLLYICIQSLPQA